MAYYKGAELLASAQVIKPRPPPKAPETWLSEEEVSQHVSAFVATANGLIKQAFSLTYCEDVELTLKWMGGLFGIAYLCRLFGTLGFFFLTFLAAFGWPKLYETKQKEIDAAVEMAAAKAGELYAAGMLQVNAGLAALGAKLATMKGKAKAEPAVGVPVAEGTPVEEEKKKL